ncbi:MAG: 3-deoxy-D-manno-octulosonic acid transferase [Candidatus Omnitrophica bacterium]|nr:3-deoxy-D-manno-octulosonic acid transferase [Candidatus Omnitrophota bacterium]
MVFLYNLAFLSFGLFYSPIFLSKIKQASDPKLLIRQRLGIFTRAWREKITTKKVIWIHAVSVGEVMAVKKFVEEFLRQTAEFHIVLTTVTPTGQKVAKELEGERITVCYFPFDLTLPVRSFFRTLQPQCLLLVETEIWPNGLVEAERQRVPVGIINARLSAKSFSRYRLLGGIFRPLLKKLNFILAQSQPDADRFIELGMDRERVHVLGNIKFDHLSLDSFNVPASDALRHEWGLSPIDKIFIAGSTHPGEEEILMRVFFQLRAEVPGFKMIVAPRHIERSEALCREFRKRNIRIRLFREPNPPPEFEVGVLNQIGILKNLYCMADMVFMGGSLIKHGGQNPIEAACFKRPIIHGPYVFNFEEIYHRLDEEGGALMVRDEAQLVLASRRLFHDPHESRRLGENAFAIVRKHLGATQRHLDWLFDYLLQNNMERGNDVRAHQKLSTPVSRRP